MWISFKKTTFYSPKNGRKREKKAAKLHTKKLNWWLCHTVFSPPFLLCFAEQKQKTKAPIISVILV
jgi:hypothetical protein